MYEAYLVPGLALLLFAAAFMGDGETAAPADGDGLIGDGSDDQDTPPAGTDGDDTLALTSSMLGTLDAGAGDDTITADGGSEAEFTIVTPLQLPWDTSDTEAEIEINGGAGDDVITASGTGLEVTTGAGADTVTIAGLDSSIIRADAGDTVFGQDTEDLPSGVVSPDVLTIISGAGNYVGGTSNEAVILTGAGATVAGGGGNDVVIDMGGSVSVAGGDGNDVLRTDVSESSFLASATDALSFYVGNDADTINGGAGDDRISGSHGDLLTGGSGDDQFIVFSDPDLSDRDTVITDFVPADDSLLIYVDSYEATTALQDSLTDNITVTTADGNTQILADGEVIVVLQGVTNLRIGLSTAGGEGPYTTLGGVVAPASDFDVIIARYPNAAS